MYFCPNCSYSFDIGKASSLSEEKDERKVIGKIPDLFKLLDSNEDLTGYRADFPKDDLLSNKRYIKLTENNKNQIKQIFEKHVMLGAEFKCNNCNNTQLIKNTILLYQITLNDTSNKVNTMEENILITQDPLLPHTKDYVCRNPSCITHKNTDSKDMVFFRNSNTFKLSYICCVCYFAW